MKTSVLCVCALYHISAIHGFAVNKTKLGDVASPFEAHTAEFKPGGVKGDGGFENGLLAYQVAPKKAKAFLRKRKRRSWVGEKIKELTGESSEEREERNRENNERNVEAAALARICSTSCWGSYGAYGACSAPCGNNGVQMATRRVTPSAQCQSWVAANGCPGSATTARACNRFCHNGGTPGAGSCSCSVAFTGTCCETSITCGSPGSIANGAVTPAGSTHNYGTRATFSCVTGYRLVGGATRTCQANRQWSGAMPSCQIISCGDPGTPANGTRTLTAGFNYGSSARFTCSTGYNLRGDVVRRCEQDGAWTGSQPSCQQIVCPAPPALSNGSVQTAGGHVYGADVIYTCETGFYLRGISTRTCHVNAQWGGDAPTCQAIVCENVRDPSHGNVSYSSGTSYGSVVSYSCEAGYRLDGTDASRTCLGSGPAGAWSGTAPSCQILSCSDPGTPDDGVKVGSTYTYGSAVTYQCLAGYAISGATRLECQANQRWSANTPSCQACALNTFKPRSNVESCSTCPTHTHTAQTASVAQTQCLCDDGYRGQNGGPCELIVCPDIPLPVNAVQTSCNKHFRGQCVFGCVGGHVRTGGEAVRVCEYQSDWSGDDIVCTACPKDTYKSPSGTCLGCPPYSYTEGPGNDMDGCVCDTGFQRLGDPGTQCTDIDECDANSGGCNQTCENILGNYTCLCTDPGFIKSEEQPEMCIPKNICPSLPAPSNGGFVCVGQPRTNTQRCQVKCNHGYEHVLEPTYYEECGPTSNWQWSHTLRDVPIMPCEQQFFPGFQMEAEVFYFVQSCDSLTPSEVAFVKQEFLDYLTSQNMCGSSGIVQCSISDVTLECGDVTLKRRKRSSSFSQLKFTFTVSIPALPRSEVDCNDVCIRQSYCEDRCSDNYNNVAEDTLVSVSNVITAIFNSSYADLPTAARPTSFPEGEDENGGVTMVTFGGLLLIPDIVVVENVSVFCDVGFTHTNDKCVPCPAGYFYDDAECHPCPVRTYQPEVEALECLPCATATEKGLNNCPPRRNSFDVIIDSIFRFFLKFQIILGILKG